MKQEIDSLKSRLDKKEYERRAKNNHVDKHEDMFDERAQDNDVIDEEELMLLKQMKDTKKQYKDGFTHLKELKEDLVNN